MFNLIFYFFFHLGASKRRRASFSGGYSSNDEGIDGTADSPSGQCGDHSPSVRKQPKRIVKPRVYFDLVDYESDLDDKGVSSSASPARRRGHGPRFNEGKLILPFIFYIHQEKACMTHTSSY